MNKRVLIWLLILTHFSEANDKPVLSGEILLGERAAVCHFHNHSKHPVLIKDLQHQIVASLDGIGRPFSRGKEWTFLRNANAGFASDTITFKISDLNVSEAKRKSFGGKIKLHLRVARFDLTDGKVGQWERVLVEVKLEDPPSIANEGVHEVTKPVEKVRRIVEFDDFEKDSERNPRSSKDQK